MLSEWIQKNITFVDLDENKDNYYKKIEDFLTNMKNEKQNNEIQEKKEEYNLINRQEYIQNIEKEDYNLINKDFLDYLLREDENENNENIQFLGNKREENKNKSEEKDK